MVAPSWAPALDQVANYVTSRTVDLLGDPGSDEPAKTFTSTTTPTNVQVLGLIEDACSWVTTVTGTLATSLEGDGAAVAALRVAGLIELSYPTRNADVDAVSNPLLLQAKFARDELAAANRTAGVAGPNATGSPVYGFPDPSAWRGNEPSRF